MNKLIIVIILSIVSIFSFGQEIKLNYKIDSFASEVQSLLHLPYNQNAINIGDSFAVVWDKYTPNMQTQIIAQTKQLIDADAKVQYHLLAYFDALTSAIINESASNKVLTSYLEVTQKIIDEYPLSKSSTFFKTTAVFFKSGALFHSKSYQLFTKNRNYSFEFVSPPIEQESKDEEYEDENYEDEEYEDENYEDENYEDENYEDENYEDENYEDESYEDENYEDENYEDENYEDENYEDENYEDENYEDEEYEDEEYEDENTTETLLGPIIQFEHLNLEITNPFDTNIVKECAGAFLIMDNIFVGSKGKIDWSSVGLPSDTVFATFKKFKFDVTKPNLFIKGAKLTYTPFLEEPILGEVEYKLEKKIKINDLLYPQFTSFSNKIEVRNLGKSNFFYTGGFSLRGREILSKGKFKELSKIKIENQGIAKLRSKSFNFIIKDSILTAKKASITLYDKYDSIYHRVVKLSYNLNTEDLLLLQEDGDFRNTPYTASLYGISFTADIIRWHLPQDTLYISSLSARSELPLIVQSDKYYGKNVFDDVVGLYNFNPLKLVLAYGHKQGSDRFYSDDLAVDKNIEPSTLKGAMLNLMQKVYIDYNTTSGEVVITEKAKHKGLALEKKADYDDIMLYSKIDKGFNGMLDLRLQEFHFKGVEKFNVSKTLGVLIKPLNEKIIIMPNKDIKFNGLITAGTLDFIGKNFIFRYDSFLVELKEIDSIQLYTFEENSIGGKRKKTGNPLEGDLGEDLELKIDTSTNKLNSDTVAIAQNGVSNTAPKTKKSKSSGILYINKPNNKSGKELALNYPKFTGKGAGSVIYFDNYEILKGVYNRSIFFKVPPFVLDSIGDNATMGLSFLGVFYSSDWFPKFAETLHLMPDRSLGFSHSIPPEGYSLFGGKAKLFNRLTLDKLGLVGDGELHFLTSVLKSDAFTFYPDSVVSASTHLEMKSEKIKKVSFPQISAVHTHMKWLHKKNNMYIDSNQPFSLYNKKAKLNGALTINSMGVEASGTLRTDNSKAISKKYKLSAEKYQAEHADFSILSTNPDKPTLLGNNVNLNFDFLTKIVKINSAVVGHAAFQFPYAQFNTSITNAIWDLEGQKVSMTKPEDVPIEDSYFYTTREELDSLVFNASKAEYNIKTLELKVSGIPYIIVADAKITPENGEILILKDAQIRELHNTSIILDTLNELHEVYNASVKIISRNNFEGEGTYRFINALKDTFSIKLSNFHLEEFKEKKRKKEMHTVANGNVEEKAKLIISPRMFYRGDIKLVAHKPALALNGFIKLDLKNIPNYDTWIMYSSDADQKEVTFDFDNSLTSKGKKLSAGLHFKYQDFSLYSTFCSEKKDDQDSYFFTPSGLLSFEAESNKFTIINREKKLGKNYSGKVFEYNEATQDIYFEGPIDFINDNEFIDLKASAIGVANMITNDVTFESFITIDFDVNHSLFDLMSNDFQNEITELGAQDIEQDKEVLLTLLAEAIGERAIKNYQKKSALRYSPLSEASPKLVKPIVFSKVKLKWSEDQKSFYNDGSIGLSNILKVDLNANFESFFEIKKTSEGEKVNLFIKASPDSWYYFSLEENMLLMYSSNNAFNTYLAEKNTLEEKKIGAFQFGLSNYPDMLNFINSFRATYLNINKNYKLDTPPPPIILDTPTKERKKGRIKSPSKSNKEEEEDDGFNEE